MNDKNKLRKEIQDLADALVQEAAELSAEAKMETDPGLKHFTHGQATKAALIAYRLIVILDKRD